MPWFRLEGRGAFHQKVISAGDEAYGAWVRAGQWSCDQLTDGFIPKSTALLINRRQKVWEKLVEVRLLHESDGGYQIHDFLDWNPSSEQERTKREAMREKRREAGKAGGKRSGEVRRGEASASNDRSKNEANVKQSASDLAKQNAEIGEAKRSSESDTESDHTHTVRARADAHTHARDEAVGDELPPPSCTVAQLAAVLRENPATADLAADAMVTDLHGGWLMARGRQATPEAARRAIGALIGQKGVREMATAQKRTLAAKYLNNQRQDYGAGDAGPPTASPDVRAVLELFAEEWERANRRKCIAASGDEKHAAKLWRMASEAARPEDLKPLDLVHHWVRSYLRDDADRLAVDAGQPMALVAARVTKYGLPKRKPRDGATVDQQSAIPEPLPPLPSGDFFRELATNLSKGGTGEPPIRRRVHS